MRFQLASLLGLATCISALGTIQTFQTGDCTGSSVSNGFNDIGHCLDLPSYKSFSWTVDEGQSLEIQKDPGCNLGDEGMIVNSDTANKCVTSTKWKSVKLAESSS